MLKSLRNTSKLATRLAPVGWSKRFILETSGTYEREQDMFRLEREMDENDVRIEQDYPQTRIPGPKLIGTNRRRNTSGTKNTGETDELYNRSFIEKQHIEYGWSKLADKDVNLWYKDGRPDGNRKRQEIDGENNKGRQDYNWPYESMESSFDASLHSDALMEIGRRDNGNDSNNNNNNNNAFYNCDDLTTFEGFSQFSRSATYKAALNLGVHWGKDKNKWHVSMAPYLKGVVDNKHVFDLTLTIANLRKVIRLLQSLIMDECNILFVATTRNRDLRNLVKIMATRCDLPCLDSDFAHGSLMDWDNYAAASRGPGREMLFKSESIKLKKFVPEKKYSKSKLHRIMAEPPDFILSFDRSRNDLLIHEANSAGIPVACLCDSDDTTRDLQYVIPCNTQSLQSVHFVCDMITRGILEAKCKKDSLWWAKKQDYNETMKLLQQIESNWQAKYDPYQRARQSKSMMGGGGAGSRAHDSNDIKLPILTPGDYSTSDENVGVKHKKSISLNKFGDHQRHNTGSDRSSSTGDGMDIIEQSRIDAHQTVQNSQKYSILQKDSEYKPKYFVDETQKSGSATNPQIQSTKYFLHEMLEKHAKKRVRTH